MQWEILIVIIWKPTQEYGVSPRKVVVNVLDWDIVVSEFELKSRYYVNFRTK